MQPIKQVIVINDRAASKKIIESMVQQPVVRRPWTTKRVRQLLDRVRRSR
jgi:hypothetical protein